MKNVFNVAKVLFGIVFILGSLFAVAYFGESKSSASPRDQDNPRDKISMDTVYYNDSVFVLTTQITKAYAEHQK